MNSRKDILLRAAFDMLRKCQDSHYALSPMEVTVFYDGTDCDGTCLLEDIASELNIEHDESPLYRPLKERKKKMRYPVEFENAELGDEG